MTFLPLIEAVDSFPYETNSHYWRFCTAGGDLLGYIVPEIAERLAKSGHFTTSGKTVLVAASLDTFEKRNAAFAEVGAAWRETDELLAHGWRDELYVVYSPRTQPYALIERAFSCLLGVVTYGVHVNGYVAAENSSSGEIKMWVPRRLPTKQTYPGKLDNTIAGGLAYPHGLWANVVKECYEEGGLSAEFVEQNARSAGVVSYLCQPYGPLGHAQPEMEYIYDLEFPLETEHVPHPVDGEAEHFTLMLLSEVCDRVRAGEFKPNCALIMVDFMIRHGVVTPENEPNYAEIVSRMHRRFPFATRN